MNKILIKQCLVAVSISMLLLCLAVKDMGAVTFIQSDLADSVLGIDQSELYQMQENITKKGILNYLSVRQRLFECTYEQLQLLKKRLNSEGSISLLLSLIDDVCRAKADIYTFNENFVLNNIPVQIALPFYKGEKLRIEAIEKSAERLYFDNLKLNYKKQELNKQDEQWFVNPEVKGKSAGAFDKNRIKGIKEFLKEHFADLKAEQQWEYQLNPNSIYNISHERLPVKRYSENSIQPVIYDQTVIFRNEYRIFGVDKASGQELWSVSPDKSGEEFYETVMHQHHIAYGYELLIDDDVLYTEIAGKLVAFDLAGSQTPRLKWEQDLGEYTFAIKPIKVKDVLIVGLINARGELWVCGFSTKTSSLNWSTYVGLSAFASPVCSLAAVVDEKVVLGTNHGVLISLQPQDGSILWVRKYEQRKYSIFDYFSKKQFKYRNIEHEGFIAFDSEFLKQTDSNRLAYKPRESDFVYQLNLETGEVLSKIRNDFQKYCILGVSGSSLVILEREENSRQKLIIIDQNDNQIKFSKLLVAGELKGALSDQSENLIFKINETVYWINFQKNTIDIKEIVCHKPGWLLQAEKDLVFLADYNKVQCFKLIEEQKNENNSSIRLSSHFPLSGLSEMVDEFIQANSSEGWFKSENQAIKALFLSWQDQGILTEKIILDIAKHKAILRSKSLNKFFLSLKDVFGEEIISYKNVSLRFDRYLSALGIIDLLKSVALPDSTTENIPPKILVPGLYFSLLPVNVINGPAPNFFIAAHNDKIYCVNDGGDILWQRKIAFRKQSNGFKNLDVYLCNGMVIINDKINVIAVDMKTGSYIWSMTHQGFLDKNIFVKENNYIEFKTAFFKDKVVLARQNNLFILDVFSGLCLNELQVDAENIKSLAVFGEIIFLAVERLGLTEILVINEEFETKDRICLDTEKISDGKINFYKIDNQIVIQAAKALYAYDINNCKLVEFYNLASNSEACLEKIGDNLILFEPFKRLIGFKLENNLFSLNWQHDLGEGKVKSILDEDLKTSFVAEDKNLIVFTKKSVGYAVLSINSLNGQVNWEHDIGFLEGKELADVFKLHCVDNFVYLMIYSALKLTDESEQKNCKKNEEFAFDLYPILIKLNKTTGKVESFTRFPRLVSYGYQRGVFINMGKYILFTLNGNYLYSQPR